MIKIIQDLWDELDRTAVLSDSFKAAIRSHVMAINKAAYDRGIEYGQEQAKLESSLVGSSLHITPGQAWRYTGFGPTFDVVVEHVEVIENQDTVKKDWWVTVSGEADDCTMLVGSFLSMYEQI